MQTIDVQGFQKTVWDYYHAHKRPMPWRQNPSPYYVVVSELMLQQTQVSRVLPKFEEFIGVFPDFQTLAKASLADVLAVWSGLGYNRRAKFLWQLAQAVNGELPRTIDELVKLPGIGPNTAGAIMAYAYNQPTLFIETNIRTVFIHHFFGDASTVTDAEIRDVLEQTLPAESPREWYWALMDYGTHLKATTKGTLKKVSGYRPQSRFEGSKRQIRGKVLRLLLGGAHLTNDVLQRVIPDERLDEVLSDLHREQLISHNDSGWHLT